MDDHCYKSLNGAFDSESDDLAQKIYFHNLVEQKGWHVFKAFFLEK